MIDIILPEVRRRDVIWVVILVTENFQRLFSAIIFNWQCNVTFVLLIFYFLLIYSKLFFKWLFASCPEIFWNMPNSSINAPLHLGTRNRIETDRIEESEDPLETSSKNQELRWKTWVGWGQVSRKSISAWQFKNKWP